MEQCLEGTRNASVGYEKARELLKDPMHEQPLDMVSSRCFSHGHIGELYADSAARVRCHASGLYQLIVY